jgi:uncharacterized Zn finger protein (UPF0148 family)
MFDNLQKTLRKLEQTKEISIPIEADEKGYIDKQCPSEECEFIFKIHQDDWTNKVNDDAIWCPFCRHEAPSKSWYTVEQIEHGKAEAFSMIQGEVHNAMISDAQRFNRKHPKGGLISMSMKVGGGRKRTRLLPAKAAEAMQLEITCDECDTRFSVIGSAYFCPACGHNSVVRTFKDSLRKIKVKVENISIVRAALVEAVGKDEAEITCRSMVESCIIDGVVAFQKYSEGKYEKYGKYPFNAFQRLKQGSELWVKAVGTGYSDWISPEELLSLNVLFQKRHILSHNEGIVDQSYIDKSEDYSYKVGQRIVVSPKDISRLLECLEKISLEIDRAVQ